MSLITINLIIDFFHMRQLEALNKINLTLVGINQGQREVGGGLILSNLAKNV